MNGVDWLIRAFIESGVEIVFGYPGGAIMPVYDTILQHFAWALLVRRK